MEHKQHYKLKKVKKHWVAVAISTLVGTFIGVAPPVLANSPSTEVTSVGLIQEEVTKDEATTPPQEANTTSQETNTTTQETDTTTQNTAINEEKPDSESKSESKIEENAIATNDQLTSTVSSGSEDTTVESEATDTPSQTDSVDQKTTTSTQSTTDSAETRTISQDPQKNTASSGQAVLSDSLLQSVPSLTKINGEYFYVGEDGNVKKNFSLQVENQLLYFNKETGALSDTSRYAFTEGLDSLVTEYTEHNQILSTELANMETVDSYLLADSWYRPKDILTNGTDWTASTEADLRPLLMTWWPDKQTQINYLNFMTTEGLGTGVVYTSNSTQAALNLAAQEVQRKIETKIAQKKGTDWLRATIRQFVKTQPNWNISSESETTGTDKDHLQGGALLYSNSTLTPHANSDYRLLNRTPTSQTGEPAYFTDLSIGGYEFLLANDIDNSNPVVQAEQLNWLHYLMNYGSIVANDPTANFDGVRIDAVDNVTADLLQIASDYFKSHYGVENSEADAIAHLSILEAWSDNDPYYNRDNNGAQLPIDNLLRLSLLYAFMRPLNERSGLEPAITNSLNNRSSDQKNNERMANYVFVRAHDSEVQTVIAKIIRENINPNTDGLTFTLEELEKAFLIYNADMRTADKKYTQFNIPSAYALMLSNKDAITRVYYGDLYTDDGQYMATKSPYYDALDTLMRARYRYVSGGQDMAVTYVGSSDNPDFSYNGVLTSVRYGTGAETATDLGTSETRTQGMAVITSNNPDLQLGETDKVTVSMGAAHTHQAYRPLLLTTQEGLATYLTDADVPSHLIRYTDANGNLSFDANDIAGYSNVQVSGYLAVWVPLGAPADQDVRVAPSTEANTSGKVYQSSAALDSQLMYEGFSNFQDFVQTDSQYTNKVIAQNVDLFKAWGVTSFEMAPQYVASEDGSFLDAIILNGYAFEDRYDLAMSKNNKYGSNDDMLNALRALHSVDIQVIADWVPDQIYNLPGKEIVTATRVNNYGTYREGAEIYNLLYAAQTRTSGDDYQAQYGGAFLDELQEKYPELFERVQISNGQKMTTDIKIKEWKAEYFNGTNILGRGAYYVLKDRASDTYFTMSSDNTYLPKQLTNQEAKTGFLNDGEGIIFYSSSGYQAISAFIEDVKGNWYYFDKTGHMVYGQQEINGSIYYFLQNGVQLRDTFLENKDGSINYFDALGKRYSGDYYAFDTVNGETKWRYFDKNGVMAIGLQPINSGQYFDHEGFQIKGDWVNITGIGWRYFEHNTGNMAINRFANDDDGNWYYLGQQGERLIGLQEVDGERYYFDSDGKQIKGSWVTTSDGKTYHFEHNSGILTVNRFANDDDGNWYYLGADGLPVTGQHVIANQTLYFLSNGKQVKGDIVISNHQTKDITYYDADSGNQVFNRFAMTQDGTWYYIGQNGYALKGSQTINGQKLFFAADGKQIKGDVATDENGVLRYYDKDSGSMVYNRIVTLANGRRIAINRQGVARYLS